MVAFFKPQILVLVGVALLWSNPSLVRSQDALEQSLGLTKETGSLPLWAKAGDESNRELGETARKAHSAVMLIGSPKGSHGTGFVISRQHRLVATNAHVADIKRQSETLLAISDGTAQVYRVERIWYHPGVRRSLASDPSVVVRSSNPDDGDVDPLCPDVAVLELAMDGPELPAEFELADAADLDSLFARPVGMIGFPGHDTSAWPAVGDTAASTYYAGVVSRITDFSLNPAAGRSRPQLVQYTMASWFGYSGSPVFLPNGRVVALHNCARNQDSQGHTTTISHGVRIDCLWELLVHHGLDDRVPINTDKSTLDIERWLETSAEEENLRRAVELTAEARRWVEARENYSEAAAKCNEALRLAPNYARAFQTRSLASRRYVFDNYRSLDRTTSLQQLSYALADAKKYMQLAPSDPEAFLDYGTVLNNTAYLTKNQADFEECVAIAKSILSSDSLGNYYRARAHSLRAMAYGNLRQSGKAIEDYEASLTLDPDNPQLWDTRADYWQNTGRREEAEADKRRARELRARAQMPKN